MKSKYLPPPRFLPKISSRRSPVVPFLSAAYMADLLDLPSCATKESLFNTGKPLCDVLRKKPVGIIYLDKGVTFSSGDMASQATFLAALKTKCTAARGSRAYPVWDLFNFNDETGDPQTGGFGNLTTATFITNDAVPAFSMGYEGGELRHRMLTAIMSGVYDFLVVDEGYNVYGCNVNGAFGGYSTLQNYVYAPKFPIADAVDQYRFRSVLSSMTQYRDQSAFFQSSVAIKTAVGLINVVLKHESGTGNAKTISAIALGGTNLTASPYGSILDDPAMWVATNLETGAAFTITSVTISGTNFVVTLDSTAWTALTAGHRVQINLAAAATLAAAGVTPFEGIAIIVTKP